MRHSCVIILDFLTTLPSNWPVLNKQIVPWYRGTYCANGPQKVPPKKNINGVSLRHRVEIDSAPWKRCGVDLLMNILKNMNWWSSIKRHISFSRTFFSGSRSNFWTVQYPVCASQLLWGCNYIQNIIGVFSPFWSRFCVWFSTVVYCSWFICNNLGALGNMHHMTFTSLQTRLHQPSPTVCCDQGRFCRSPEKNGIREKFAVWVSRCFCRSC